MNRIRRNLLAGGLAGTSLALAGCASIRGNGPIARVVVVGGGYGGATAAKYIRQWEPRIDVTLVERNEAFVSCPISNLVLAGVESIENITVPYSGLARYGVKVVRDDAVAIDVDRRQVRLARGDALPYDRLILAPGIDFELDGVPGLAAAQASGRALHAWKAGPQTLALRRQLEELRDGAVFAISVPKMPYRCPPGPYERASVIADYFRKAKPRSKILVLDGNPDITSKKGLFLKAWNERYKGIIEYRPNSELTEFDAARNVAVLQVEDVRADLFNIVPPQRAGDIARPFVSVNNRWVGVSFQTFESTTVAGVHVIGDATASAPGMPKSGFMANNHAKVAADSVIALITGRPVNESPVLANTCYSFVSHTQAMHVASVHRWDAEQKTVVPVKGAGGLSESDSEVEGRYARSWARNIWADSLG